MIGKLKSLSIFSGAFVVAMAILITVPFGHTASAGYGSIAFSQDSGAYGYSWNYSTRNTAERRALRECRSQGRGCQVIMWFRNACAALAVGYGNAYGWAWNTSRRQARIRALDECSSRADRCRIRVDVCSR